jgi:hypothetical protein
MNLFVLDRNPVRAASYYCDKHVVKIITEAAQMLCCAYPNGQAPYKHTHYNHPMNRWVRHSSWNYSWTLAHAQALCTEYTKRYNKTHKGEFAIHWCASNLPQVVFKNYYLTDWPRCFGDYKDQIPVTNDAVEDYRNYYRIAKSYFAKWKMGNKPHWYNV